MDALKNIPLPWIALGLLSIIVIIMLFRQRRSGYTPPTGNVITMMDLQEFSAFTAQQKANYVNKLKDYQNKLSNAVSTNSITTYKMLLDEVMTQSLMPSTGVPKCPPGMFSLTGSPPCAPCPLNTYCPNQGTTTQMQTQCPTGKTSPLGSIAVTMCI